MKTIMLTIIFLKISLAAHGGELTIESPDKRYSIIFRHSNGESFLPDIYLHETLTGHDIRLAHYAKIKKGSSNFNAMWSPDSNHVAVSLTGLHGFAKVHDPDQALIYVGDNPVRVWRIGVSPRISLVEFLPIPKALDTRKTSFHLSTFALRWEGNKTLWISDGPKNRCFRYRLTKNGKMLADAFKEIPKKTAEQAVPPNGP
jgi:hypothetical protein